MDHDQSLYLTLRGITLQFKTLRLVEKGDSVKKRLVVIPISTNLSTIGLKPTPVRPMILKNCIKYFFLNPCLFFFDTRQMKPDIGRPET